MFARMAGRVFFLEDNSDLRAALVSLAEEVGCEVVAAESVAGMLAQQMQVMLCHLAFLDIDLGCDEPNGLDALDWLRAENFSGRIFFLTGHASGHPLVTKARDTTGVTILQKPFPVALLNRYLTECGHEHHV